MWDWFTGRVPNNLFLIGMFLTQLQLVMQGLVTQAVVAIIIGCIVLIILFPLFAIGCIGGGDVKLMMLLPAVMIPKDVFTTILLAFVIGAAIGLLKLLFMGELVSRINYFLRYLRECSEEKRIGLYDIGVNDGNIARHQIHFTIPLFISFLLMVGRSLI